MSHWLKGNEKKEQKVREHLKILIQNCAVLEKGILQAGLNPEVIL